MDIVLTRILECMGPKHGAGKELADYLGISGNVITNWKNGSNRSYLKYLSQIAEFYDVSEDFLRGRSNLKEDEKREMEQLLEDPEFVLFARHTKKIPEADRSRILRNFRDTIDVYLRAIGIQEDEEEK